MEGHIIPRRLQAQGPSTLDHMPSVMEFEHGMLKKPTLHSSLKMAVIMRQDTLRPLYLPWLKASLALCLFFRLSDLNHWAITQSHKLPFHYRLYPLSLVLVLIFISDCFSSVRLLSFFSSSREELLWVLQRTNL